MEEIAISKFKATCLAVLENVRKTGAPVLVTRFGKPVAEILPPRAHPKPSNWLGALKDTGHIEGDIIVPAVDGRSWEAAAADKSVPIVE